MNLKLVASAISAALLGAPAIAQGGAALVQRGPLIKAASEGASAPAVPPAQEIKTPDNPQTPVTYCWMSIHGMQRWVSAPFTFNYRGSATVSCEQTNPSNPEGPRSAHPSNPILLSIRGYGRFVGIALPFSAPATGPIKIRVPDPFKVNSLQGGFGLRSVGFEYANYANRSGVLLPIPKWAILPPSASIDQLPWLSFYVYSEGPSKK